MDNSEDTYRDQERGDEEDDQSPPHTRNYRLQSLSRIITIQMRPQYQASQSYLSKNCYGDCNRLTASSRTIPVSAVCVTKSNCNQDFLNGNGSGNGSGSVG